MPALPQTAPDPLLGARLGDYAIEEMIAAGGFGAVYRARGGPRGAAAVKVLHAELAGSAEALARFAREVEVLGRLDHPGLVAIDAVGRAPDGRPWYAMELLVGRDLQAHIDERGRLAPAECLAVLEPVCAALAAAHEAGVIHRDLKASNLFLADDGRVLVLDFGIAKLGGAEVAGLTRSRQSLGTPSAMAPEQVTGGPITARTDVYGLGALVYHMLTGTPPFADGSATVIQYLHCHARRPRPSSRAPLPAALDEVVAAAMSLDPAARPAGPGELLAALRTALPVADAAAAREQRAALAVRVDVRLAAGGAGDLGPALDDAEAVWAAARAHFTTRGFACALEASESLLFVRPADAPAPAPADDDGVAEFARLIAGRDGRHPSVSVDLSTRHGTLPFAGGAPIAAHLLSAEDWTPRSNPA